MRSLHFLLAIALVSSPLSATTLNEARGLHGSGELTKAAAAYRAVLASGDMDAANTAIAHNNLCVVLDSLGDLDAAEDACRSALRIRRSLGDEARVARTLNNLGLVLQHQGRYAEATSSFGAALERNRTLQDPASQAINLANLGVVATLRGRFQEALDRYAEVAHLADEHPRSAWAHEQRITAELNRGVVLERLSAFDEALDVYLALLEHSDQLRSDQQASILVNSGVVYRNLGNPVEAIRRFEAARALYLATGDRGGIAHAELNLGIVQHLDLNDPRTAEAAYRRALDGVAGGVDRSVEIETQAYLARLLSDQGRLDEARTLYDAVHRHGEASGSSEATWIGLAGLGQVSFRQGDVRAAVDAYEAAIDAVEVSRAEVGRSDLRASFLADKRSVYAGALTVWNAVSDTTATTRAEQALSIAQRAKARDLLDVLRAAEGQGTSVRQAVQPIDIEELRSRLGTDTIWEYFVGETQLFAWRIDARGLDWFDLGPAEPILQMVRKAYADLSEGRQPETPLLEELASRLLTPLEPEPRAAIRIAPDRELFRLPFEILPVPADSGRRLVEVARVSYLPSSWAVRTRAHRRADSIDIRFAGLGNSAAGPSAGGLRPRPLQAVERELATAARSLGGERSIALGSNATEAAFRSLTDRRLGALHFAAHAVVDESGEGQGAIHLTPDLSDDGILRPSEIASRSIDARLVVLAACATAPIESPSNRALTTLAGAFLAAGSDAVLATLWSVGDQPTAAFMEQFYYRLGSGEAPERALQQVKLRMMNDAAWNNPALWSGYVLIGSGQPVIERRRWRLAAGIVIATLLIAAWLMRYRRKQATPV